MSPTAADFLADRLIEWGVDTIFGLPGDAINGFMESLRQRQDRIRFVHLRHEGAAAFAAVGYAKFSGRLGVCLATSGPGATNLLTGLYDAKFDGVPVLAITGMQFSDLIGTRYQQDVDTPALFRDVAVYSERIMGPGHLDSIADVAIRAALTGPGVAHLGFPIDLQSKPMDEAAYGHMDQPRHTSRDYRTPRLLPRDEDLQAAASVLNAGQRVAIVCGNGGRGAADEVLRTAEMLAAPVAKPYLGLDILPDDHPNVTGAMGVWETPATAKAFEECDTLLLIGSSFPYISFLPKTGQGKRVVQIDADASRIGLRAPAEVGLVGDAKETLAALLPLLRKKPSSEYLTGIQAALREFRERTEAAVAKTDGPLKGIAYATALNRHLADDAIVCGDSGQNTSWLARAVRANGRRRISGSGTLASMACALPYAVGAAFAFPGREVAAFVGDGGLSMLMGDLATLAAYKLPVKVFVAKNRALNMIRWEQMMFQGNPQYAIDIPDIDFAKVAEGCGIQSFQVSGPEDVDAVVAQALAFDGPALVQAMVDPLDPMVPGKLEPEPAAHMAEALSKDQPHAGEIEANYRRLAEHAGEESLQVADEALKKAKLL